MQGLRYGGSVNIYFYLLTLKSRECGVSGHDLDLCRHVEFHRSATHALSISYTPLIVYTLITNIVITLMCDTLLCMEVRSSIVQLTKDYQKGVFLLLVTAGSLQYSFCDLSLLHDCVDTNLHFNDNLNRFLVIFMSND